MADFITKKVISPVLIITVMIQLFWFLPSKNAEAIIDLKTASSGIISAGIGCATNKLLQKQLGKKIDEKISSLNSVLTADSATRANTASLEFKQTCLDKIARAAAQTVLKEITAQTVNYINTGFKGQPLFIRNPESFFKSIADREIGGFANLFQDQQKYPFGKSFIQGYIGSIKRTFAQNAESSLYKALAPGITPQDYYRDFSLGGWDAWFATTQIPQNNPYGFSIMASNELGGRLNGTVQSEAQNIRDELQNGLGFLSPKVCVDPQGYKAPAEGSDECKRYEVTTPGGIIANQLTTTLGSPLRQLELSDDLDSSLQAIFDALLNQLFTKGLASLSGDTNSSSTQIYSSGGYGSNTSADQSTITSSNQGDQWFNQHPDFDITDTNALQKIIDTQTDFIKALIDDPAVIAPVLISNPQLITDPNSVYLNPTSVYPSQERTIPSKGQNYWISKLIPEIYQLDYCIPGPHPGWENDARTKLVQYEGSLKDVNFLEGNALGQVYDTITLGISHSIANFLTTVFTGASADEQKRESIYAINIAEFTGIAVERDGNIGTRENVITVLDTLFDRFVNEVNNIRFNPIILPTVTNEAYAEFRKVDGYNSLIEDNNNEIILKQGSVRRLGIIKDQVTTAKNNLLAGAITRNEFDQDISALKKSFAVIASDLASDDDVNTIKNQTQQIIDELFYIHNTLLKGAVGCETDFANVPWQSQKRAPYPLPHLYNYPDPSPHVGTGTPYYTFLRSTVFGADGNFNNQLPAGDDEIHITDLINFSNATYMDSVPIFETNLGLW